MPGKKLFLVSLCNKCAIVCEGVRAWPFPDRRVSLKNARWKLKWIIWVIIRWVIGETIIWWLQPVKGLVIYNGCQNSIWFSLIKCLHLPCKSTKSIRLSNEGTRKILSLPSQLFIWYSMKNMLARCVTSTNLTCLCIYISCYLVACKLYDTSIQNLYVWYFDRVITCLCGYTILYLCNRLKILLTRWLRIHT